MDIRFDRRNPQIDGLIDELTAKAGCHHPWIIREMILSALKAGQDTDYLADLKLMRTTMKEMRYTSKVFGKYRQCKKVTIFGSARLQEDHPAYEKCRYFAQQLAQKGYMVITGGGGGIMHAGNEGAGADNSFAANIRLPFEQDTNPVMENSRNVVVYKYFFNRKVAFLKEASAVALFPGGFGTFDEAMEALTLAQTGKTVPVPLVLIDEDNGDFWENWFQFLRSTLLKKGLISGEDFSLFTITRDADEAVRIIDEFYRVYHSSRYVGKTLYIRLRKPLTQEQVEILENEFQEILEPGTHVEPSAAHEKEQDEPDLLDMPRLAVQFNRRSFGLLNAFIRRINSFYEG